MVQGGEAARRSGSRRQGIPGHRFVPGYRPTVQKLRHIPSMGDAQRARGLRDRDHAVTQKDRVTGDPLEHHNRR